MPRDRSLITRGKRKFFLDAFKKLQLIQRSSQVSLKLMNDAKTLQFYFWSTTILHDQTSHIFRKSAPQFLLDIYKKLKTAEDGEEERVRRDVSSNEVFLSAADEIAIDQSDIIMTFLNKSELECKHCERFSFERKKLLDHHVPEMRHEHGRRLWFDISEIGQDVTLMMAELRLYQNSVFSKFDEEKPLTISVYLVESRDETSHEILKLLASKNATTHSDGWLELNVTAAMAHWTEDKDNNLGLVIKASLNERPEKELRLDDFGLVNSKGDDEFQPFMVGFFKGQEVRAD